MLNLQADDEKGFVRALGEARHAGRSLSFLRMESDSPPTDPLCNPCDIFLPQVQLFVCNQEDDMAAAFALGATGVMSDYPSALSDYLQRHPAV